MNKEAVKNLADEIFECQKTFPNVIIYLAALMEKYEELEKENEKLQTTVNNCKQQINKSLECLEKYNLEQKSGDTCELDDYLLIHKLEYVLKGEE